jgi:hypothetical protein
LDLADRVAVLVLVVSEGGVCGERLSPGEVSESGSLGLGFGERWSHQVILALSLGLAQALPRVVLGLVPRGGVQLYIEGRKTGRDA